MQIGEAVKLPEYVDEYSILLDRLRSLTNGDWLPVTDKQRTITALRSGIQSAMLRRQAQVETAVDSEKGVVYVRISKEQ